MRRLLVLVLFAYLSLMTVSFVGYSQRQSQETVNAVTTERIIQIEQKQVTTEAKLDGIRTELSELKQAINQFTGIGIGFAALMSLLHAAGVYTAWRNGNGKKA